MVGNELYPQRHLRYGVFLGYRFHTARLGVFMGHGISFPLSITIKS